jgi:anti-sigma B factor antagonist
MVGEETEFHIEHSQLGDATILVPSGEIDIATCEVFRRDLVECEGDVIVDLSAVTYMDSSGIGVLVRQTARLDESGGSLRLRNPQQPVRNAIDHMGLSQLLDD